MKNDMKIRALAPWFGGKRNLAPWIVAELGEHRAYWEPFCGSMSVLLAKPSCVMETVNDLHGDIVNLARCIQHPQHGPALYRRLRRTSLHETLFLEARERLLNEKKYDSDELNIERAYDFFIVSWFGRNGVIGTDSYNYGFCARWTPNGGHGAKRFKHAVLSIPAWRRRLRMVTILRRDGFEFLSKIEDCRNVAMYVDPPYLVKGARYLHDPDKLPGRWGSLRWHVRLAKLLRRYKNVRVVLSYYDHPYLTRLYPDWTLLKIPVRKSVCNAGKRGKNQTTAVEVLLINGTSYTATAENPLFAEGGCGERKL